MGARPAISVIVPFRGDAGFAAAMVEALAGLELGPGDEVVIADDEDGGVVSAALARATLPQARVVTAARPRSAFRARNAGAAVARGQWLLFTDADCVPPADLLDRMTEPAPAAGCGVVAGEAHGLETQHAPLARWARSRRGSIASHHLESAPFPAGTTANLLVRRDAFEAVGGFREVRSDADVELCWRIQERGWGFDYRPWAILGHRDPERLVAVLHQAVVYGAGRSWLRAQWGAGSPTAMQLGRPLGRALGGALAWTLALRFERAAFKLVDGAVAAAGWLGYRLGDNRLR